MSLILLLVLAVFILIISCTIQQPMVEKVSLIKPESEENTTLWGGTKTADKTHLVEISNSGFSPHDLYIKSGDTVTWRNMRIGSYNKAIIHGTRQCVKIKSPMLKTGQEFSWTFNYPRTCMIIDAITPRDSSVVVVVE